MRHYKAGRRRQLGVTFIGGVLLLIPIAIVLYAVIRATPTYITYFSVSRAMQQVAREFSGEDQITADTVRRALQARFDTGYVDFPAARDIQVERQNDHWVMRADYEQTVPLFGSVSLLLNFDKTTEIR
jgi:hypothetical protein